MELEVGFCNASCIKSCSNQQIIFNAAVVANMNDQKHLGLILDSSLSFKKHNEKIIKAKKNLGIIKHLSIFLPHKTIDLMYKALSVPILTIVTSYIIYHQDRPNLV